MNFDLCIIYSKFNARSNDNLYKKDKLSVRHNVHKLSFKLLTISVKILKLYLVTDTVHITLHFFTNQCYNLYNEND